MMRERNWVIFPALIVLLGVCAYARSLPSPFIFDDQPAIVENRSIRHLWPIWEAVSVAPDPRSAPIAGRPIVTASFALNYALSGLHPRGYRAVNVTIHLLAALFLFGLTWRTLERVRLDARLRRYASEDANVSRWLALIVASLWLVHPIQTESVTYIVQRSECLMGLWCLLTLYSVLRSVDSSSPGCWWALAVLSCLLGMATKQTMAVVPLLALCYDRTFLAGSFRQAMKDRGSLYLGLGCSLVVFGALLVISYSVIVPTVGFHLRNVTPLEYARTQPGVILHYLRLALWPSGLCFDDNRSVAHAASEIVLPAVAISLLLLLTVWRWRRRAPEAWLGIWFFLLLAPSSSVVPLADLAFEHRMYLPLAAVVALVVIGGWRMLERFPVRFEVVRRRLAAGIGLSVALLLTGLTLQRNVQYASEIELWRDTVVKRPRNARAHHNLGVALARQGRFDEAVVEYEETLRLQPDTVDAYYNLGLLCYRQGKLDEAVSQYRRALELAGADAEAHNSLGVALSQQGHLEEAIAHYTEALELRPSYVEAHNNFGNALSRQGKLEPAVDEYLEALRLDPENVHAKFNLSLVRGKQQELARAATARQSVPSGDQR